VAFKVTADYDAMLPIARYDTEGDPQRAAELGRMVMELVTAGKFRAVGQRLSGPEVLEPLHDRMAPLTA
jgi:hypothetical protein